MSAFNPTSRHDNVEKKEHREKKRKNPAANHLSLADTCQKEPMVGGG